MTVRKGSDDVVGSVLAGYLIEALIGRGGMGAVYRAEEQGLGRKVALKVIAPELAEDSASASASCASRGSPPRSTTRTSSRSSRRERRTASLFLAMRYVEGTDLAKLLAEEGALEPAARDRAPRAGRRGARRRPREGARPP